MNDTSKKAMFFSIGLHALFFIGAALLLLLQTCKLKKDIHVFDLQELPTLAEQMTDPTPPTAKPAPAPTKSKPKPKKQEPQLDKVSYEEFVKKQGLPKDIKKTPKPVVAPKIDTSDLTKELKETLATTSKAPQPKVKSIPQDPFQAYARTLKNQVDALWDKPPVSIGYQSSALIQFVVHPNGTISEVKIKKSSGSKDFDDSILSAFTQLSKTTPPPSGKDQTFELYFNLHTSS